MGYVWVKRGKSLRIGDGFAMMSAIRLTDTRRPCTIDYIAWGDYYVEISRHGEVEVHIQDGGAGAGEIELRDL